MTQAHGSPIEWWPLGQVSPVIVAAREARIAERRQALADEFQAAMFPATADLIGTLLDRLARAEQWIADEMDREAALQQARNEGTLR